MVRLPKITKTHRCDRELIKRVESLAQRTGRPVQHVLDDALAIGLEEIEEQIDYRMSRLTPGQAWEYYVGSQTPREFWEISRDQGARTYAEAAEQYARDLPNIFREEWGEMEAGDYPDLNRVAFLLAEYMEQSGAGVYQAWLGDMLLGEGATREEAIEAAVREYEEQGGYTDDPEREPHLFRSRDELVAKLDVSLAVRDEE